ncbi:unnamed protein product [Adineta steineri]|uniref:Methyltransferase FkbM domain-containing protein n=1 Tax=Adineta steineri TaxID=433720 RepID=A0A818V8K4_9BILA|nr:unnamed protein product [Adineta steineri]CAF3709163.1 unnamed protein product [Adineta steineri]
MKQLNCKKTSSTVIQFSEQFNKGGGNKCILPKCTRQQKERQASLFSLYIPQWSGCYDDYYLLAFDNYDTSTYTLIDVGSNKAYTIATWFAFFLPELNITQANLDTYLQSTKKLKITCGSCDDCEDEPLTRKNTKHQVTLNVHAFEPQPDTVVILDGVKKWMNIRERSKSTFSIHGMAVSNYDGKVLFKKCNPGNEVCSLDVSHTSIDEKVEVDVVTLDHFADQHNLSRIDVLKIDTEGYEPFVFQGAKRLLEEHRIRLFIFEQLETGAWLNTTLQIEVSKLTKLGYICYIIGKTGMILVTNCWSDKYDVQHNNLLCVSSRDGALLNSIDQMRLTGTVSGICEKRM